MTRKPAAPSNMRNGLKWRDGRPRWEPSPANRACGFAGLDLRAADGSWMDRGAATTAADARTIWARFVREAMREDDTGGKARAMLRAALDRLPPIAADPHARSMVADLIERGRAVLEDREPEITHALSRGPRTVAAMIDGFFADAEALNRIAPATRRAYRIQSAKLRARFGTVRADEVTRPQVRQWYLDMQRDISIATANVAIGAAGAIFRWATWQDPAWLETSPCDKIGRDHAPGRRVFWSVEAERVFVEWCDANGFADVADCLTAGIWTGARQIDVCAADVPELERPTWRYVPEKTKRRRLEALPGLLAPVHRRAARRRLESASTAVRHLNAIPFLWDGTRGRRHTSKSIGDRFTLARAAIVKAGVMPGTFDTLQLRDARDTCVTRLWAAGITIERIATWGGWAVKTCMDILRDHYLCLLEEGAIETAGQLETWAVNQGLDMTAVG